MLLRKCLILVAVLVIITASAASVYAVAPGEELHPNYDNAINANATISVSNGTASLKGTLTGKPGVTKIKCTLTLQKKDSGTWGNVESWSKEVNATSISFTKTRSISHGTYRTKAKFKVYKGGTSETITKYSSQVTY